MADAENVGDQIDQIGQAGWGRIKIPAPTEKSPAVFVGAERCSATARTNEAICSLDPGDKSPPFF